MQGHGPRLPIAQPALGYDACGAGQMQAAGVEEGAGSLASDPQPPADFLEGPSLVAQLRDELSPPVVGSSAHRSTNPLVSVASRRSGLPSHRAFIFRR
jgi:hypothetical protein